MGGPRVESTRPDVYTVRFNFCAVLQSSKPERHRRPFGDVLGRPLNQPTVAKPSSIAAITLDHAMNQLAMGSLKTESTDSDIEIE